MLHNYHITTFMRANPPTIAHQELIEYIIREAHALNSSHSILISHSEDSRNNPIDQELKLQFLNSAVKANYYRSTKIEPGILHHLTFLHKQGVRYVTMVVGKDRVSDFGKLIRQYNGTASSHGYYHFYDIDIISFGERHPDGVGLENISSTVQRHNATENDIKAFAKNCCMVNRATKVKMFQSTRKGMGLTNNWFIKDYLRLLFR